MKNIPDFCEFLKSIDDNGAAYIHNAGSEVEDYAHLPVPTDEVHASMFAVLISSVSYKIALQLLEDYHKWLMNELNH